LLQKGARGKMRLKVLFIIVIILNSLRICAQYYENGQDPFSVNWKKIETSNFQLIFSDEITFAAKQYAALFEEIYKTGGATLGHNPHKLPIIIHNQNVISNGEVAWVPKRMNLYAIPSQSGNAEPYAKHLAIHEFRHVVQIDKLNQSTTKYLYYFLGEQVIGAILGWHIPLWFFEGDAVYYETGASNTGRGAIPDFEMKLKAQIADFGIYSYPKAQFGSYKNFVPNHYELGYQLVARSRLKYGIYMWDRVLNQVAKSPIHPNSFSKGIKNITSLPERELYNELMLDIQKEVLNYKLESNEKSNEVVNYFSPYWIGDKILSYKTSYDNIPRLIISEGNKEKVVFTPGNIYDQTYSYNDSILIWNEYKGTRWANKNYTRIVKYNLETNKRDYLTKKTRAYNSRISFDNTQILSVEVEKNLEWAITIRDAEQGILVDSIVFEGSQPLRPGWSPDMKEIVFMLLNEKGKSLGIINLKTRHIQWVIKDKYLDMDFPVHTGNAIIIKGVFKGKSNHLLYDLNAKVWHALTNTNYGVGEGQLINNEFVFSDYSSNGYRLSTIDITDGLPIIKGPEYFDSKLLNSVRNSEEKVLTDNLNSDFQVENYNRLKYLFNIHSWAPVGINIQNKDAGPGLTAMSQNALSTSVLMGGYQYNIFDESHRVWTDFTYKGFYPLLTSQFSITYAKDSVFDENKNGYLIKYTDKSALLIADIPFNFDRGKWYRRLQPRLVYEYSEIEFSSENEAKLNDFKIHSISGQLYFSNIQTMAYRHLQPRWGQSISFKYYFNPFDSGQLGKLLSVDADLYFPGLFANHGLKFYLGYQLKEEGRFNYYSERIKYPSGYSQITNTELFSGQVNYQMPLLYPDLNIFEYVYLKRLKTNLFFHYSEFNNPLVNNLSSVGADFTTDMHIFRFVFPFDLGIRYARKLTYNENYFQFLFSVSF